MSREWIKLHRKLRRHPKYLGLTPAERSGYIALLIEAEPYEGEFETERQLRECMGVDYRYVARLRAVGLLDDLDVHAWASAQSGSHDATGVRRVQLSRDKALRDAIRRRDGDVCQYCGVTVDWNDRRSPTGGTYDHVNPEGGNTLANVVVACKRCNSSKGNQDAQEFRARLRSRSKSDLDTAPDIDLDTDLADKRRLDQSRQEETRQDLAREPEAATRSKERERVLEWLGEIGQESDYPNANKLCVSEGWTAAEVIAASKIAIGKYSAKRPLSYVQRTVDGHSSLLSRTKVQREEAAHAERKAELAKVAKVPNEATGIIDHLAEGMSA